VKLRTMVFWDGTLSCWADGSQHFQGMSQNTKQSSVISRRPGFLAAECHFQGSWSLFHVFCFYTVHLESCCTLIKGVWSLEVTSTSVCTGLNPFNFIRKHFLQICCEMFLMYAVIAVFNSLSVHRRSQYTVV